MGARLILAAVWLALLPGEPADYAMAATLRTFAAVSGPSIKLSDLFVGLPVDRDCRLGDAPPPGAQFVIERPQLEAIASQFGVDWTPGPAEQTTVVERAGRTVSLAEVVDLLQKAVDRQSAPARHKIVLAGFGGVTIDRDAQLAVDGLIMDDAAGMFRAFLVASVDGRETVRVSLGGSITQLVVVPVALRTIIAGQVLSAGDLSVADVDVARIHGTVIEKEDEGIGFVSTRNLKAGDPIERSGLRRPDLVTRGAPVMMRLSSVGIELDARGEAIVAGAMGDQVQVRNPGSHAILLATVIGPNQVRIDPGSTPYLSGDNDQRGGGFGSPLSRVSFPGGDAP